MQRRAPSPDSVIAAALLCAIVFSPVAAAAQDPGPQRARQGGDATSAAAAPELQVRIAAAPDIAQQPNWSSGLHCATLRASQLLQSAIGRGLRIRDRVAWRAAPTSEGPRTLRSHLIRNVDHEGADLVVGLVSASAVTPIADFGLREDGLAAYSQGYLVLRVGQPLCDAGRLLAHEIAHIFGGIHRPGEDNLMDPQAPGTEIDELNAALFKLHRDRMIRTQRPPLQGEMLRMMWRLARADLGAATTWLRVGVLAATMGKPEAACGHYERALSIDPSLRTAWVNVGHARLQMEEFEAAEEAYDTALELDPDDGAVHNNLAIVYLSTGRPRRAQAAMNRALELGYDVPAGLREAIRASVGGLHDSGG